MNDAASEFLPATLGDLVRNYPFMEGMDTSMQEAVWHAEGDAWTHTKMVRKELEALLPQYDLTDMEKRVLRYAAVFHDCGKPSTLRLVDGVLRNPKHALRGSQILQTFWWNEGYDTIPEEERRLIQSLIRYHGRPPHTSENPNIDCLVAATSTATQCDLIAILAEADMRGRLCNAKDVEEALFSIELFREMARTLKCEKTPYVWQSPHARWHFLKNFSSNGLNYQAYDDRTFKVHLLCGLPGSGKSTLAAKLGCPVVSRDTIREENKMGYNNKDQGRTGQLFNEQVKVHLRKKEDFTIDGTNLLQTLRTNVIEVCANYGAAITIHHLDRDRKTILRQNKDREGCIPETYLVKMADGMEFPSQAEAHEIVHA